MKFYQNILHPRKKLDDGLFKPFPLCGTPTGRLTNTSDKDDDELYFEEVMGVGMVVYFRLLKYLVCMFFVFTLLSIPSLIMYQAGNQQAEGGDMKAVFSRYSLGNLGGSVKACADGDVNGAEEDEVQTLLCQYGTI